MFRFLGLVIVCVVLFGAISTFDIPLSWIGNLPGDFSMTWRNTLFYLPIGTSVVFSLVLSAFLFLFGRH